MAPIRLLIEVYGGLVRNVYVAREEPRRAVEAVIVDWDGNRYEGLGDCVSKAVAFEGIPGAVCVLKARLKPWRLLPTAGLQEVLEEAGWGAFGSPAVPLAGQAAQSGSRRRRLGPRG